MSEEIVLETETDKYGQEVRIDRYDKFRHSNGAYYAFAERPIADLDSLIPKGVKWGQNKEGAQKSVREFVSGSVEAVGELRALIPLCAIERPTLRQKPVTKEDLDDWKYYAGSQWSEPLEMLTTVEYNSLLETEEYKQ